jgi:methionine synthase II (cobalamin-independent)
VQVEKQLDAVVTAGLLQRDDFNDRIMAALRGMQVSSDRWSMSMSGHLHASRAE